MLDLIPIKLMASIFTPEFAIGNKLHLINFFSKVTNNKFDGELFSAPMPQEAPIQIPRVILQSADGAWKLEITLERTNLIYQKPNLDPVNDHEAQNFGEFAKKLFSSYKTKFDIRIQRLAYITERGTRIANKPPSQFIADKYCKEEFLKEPFNRTEAFELHSLKKYKFKNFDINSWVRLKSVNLMDPDNTPLLLVENDINTLSENQNANFNSKKIEVFFHNVPNHQENIIKLYFKT